MEDIILRSLHVDKHIIFKYSQDNTISSHTNNILNNIIRQIDNILHIRTDIDILVKFYNIILDLTEIIINIDNDTDDDENSDLGKLALGDNYYTYKMYHNNYNIALKIYEIYDKIEIINIPSKKANVRFTITNWVKEYLMEEDRLASVQRTYADLYETATQKNANCKHTDQVSKTKSLIGCLYAALSAEQKVNFVTHPTWRELYSEIKYANEAAKKAHKEQAASEAVHSGVTISDDTYIHAEMTVD